MLGRFARFQNEAGKHWKWSRLKMAEIMQRHFRMLDVSAINMLAEMLRWISLEHTYMPRSRRKTTNREKEKETTHYIMCRSIRGISLLSIRHETKHIWRASKLSLRMSLPLCESGCLRSNSLIFRLFHRSQWAQWSGRGVFLLIREPLSLHLLKTVKKESWNAPPSFLASC